MTDDLILQAREMQKRMIATTLPGELADALEAQARRIAELENELAGWHKSQSRHYDKLHARIEELEAALKPFADAADDYGFDDFDDERVYLRGFNIGQLRAARAALEKKE